MSDEPKKPTIYRISDLTPSELGQRLRELRSTFQIPGFKIEKSDINDYYAYVLLMLDNFEQRINKMEAMLLTLLEDIDKENQA